MKTIQFTDDLATLVPAIKMKCECGWLEKANADRDAPERARRHLEDKHSGGKILYQGHAIEVFGGKG